MYSQKNFYDVNRKQESIVTVEVPGTSSNDSSLAVQHENEQISSQISTPVFSSHKIFEQEESQSSIVCEESGPMSPVQSTGHNIQHTPKSRKDLRRRVGILRSIGVTRVQQLTPKARKLHRIARGFKLTARTLDFECASVKKHLKEAQRLLDSPEFMQTKRLSPKARRFTLDDKIMALALWKQSPKGYKLLRKIFAVPSRKTLMNLLRTIPFETGMNRSIVDLLKTSVSTMDPLDRYCTIMFDKMSIDPSLLYNQAKDVIEGFQDNGGDERRLLFADKVMVFMARGIHKKWKQPMAYYFNEGGMKKRCPPKNTKRCGTSSKICWA
ncbi:hypothetical protein NQ317_007699 [Molorchus minor]|uniref:Transposable element P transposase-like RNase H domain-containing protein n=1 Tax=Molorchus minor TaxID=1323400 RepID=A0ABQ9JNF0_9CUCU|nr:hypothetical protein NQ317_007699 [Molorchus minor]